MSANGFTSPNKSANILLVDDNAADTILAKKAFSKACFPCSLTGASNGEEAMAFLRGEEKQEKFDMVLLDLNLPGQDGREILGAIKGDKNLRYIPIIILSTSCARRDVLDCSDLQASCYVVKPIDFKGFCEFVDALAQFWFRHAVRPLISAPP